MQKLATKLRIDKREKRVWGEETEPLQCSRERALQAFWGFDSIVQEKEFAQHIAKNFFNC